MDFVRAETILGRRSKQPRALIHELTQAEAGKGLGRMRWRR